MRRHFGCSQFLIFKVRRINNRCSIEAKECSVFRISVVCFVSIWFSVKIIAETSKPILFKY
jgi:hypothetical protein